MWGRIGTKLTEAAKAVLAFWAYDTSIVCSFLLFLSMKFVSGLESFFISSPKFLSRIAYYYDMGRTGNVNNMQNISQIKKPITSPTWGKTFTCSWNKNSLADLLQVYRWSTWHTGHLCSSEMPGNSWTKSAPFHRACIWNSPCLFTELQARCSMHPHLHSHRNQSTTWQSTNRKSSHSLP